VRARTQVVGAAGAEHLERLSLCDTGSGTVEEVPASFLFVFIGASPCTEWLDGVVKRDHKGFVLTGPDLLVGGKRPRGWPLGRDPYYLEGSVPGIFAAGDARANSVKRVASAVGEGATAIQLVHRYLEAQ
jgi:thioredoxin reductase (NADPH)